MKNIQAVYRNGRVELLEELDAPNNTKLLVIVTDEMLPADVVHEENKTSVIGSLRLRSESRFTTEQQVKSREKLKQTATKISGKLPYKSMEDALKNLR